MAIKSLDKLLEQISPANQEWVRKQPREKQLELLKEWENHGGDTELGNVGNDPSSVDSDAVVEGFRKG